MTATLKIGLNTGIGRFLAGATVEVVKYLGRVKCFGQKKNGQRYGYWAQMYRVKPSQNMPNRYTVPKKYLKLNLPK